MMSKVIQPGIILLMLLTITVGACGASTGPRTGTEGPGKLVSQRELGNLDPALSAAVSTAIYIRYQSTSPAGRLVEVSGAVFLPVGVAPAGGWPVVAFAHGTSGVVSECAPTDSPTLFGSAPAVRQLLAAHRAVVMTNYQGLDGPGNAPYLDSSSSGFDVLNSVRAARSSGMPLAADTVLMGVSQGGRAAESAAETAKAYAPDLRIRGVVLLSPALEIKFVDAVRDATLNVPDQYLVLPYLIAAVRYGNPNYGYDRLLHGPLLAAAPHLESECTGNLSPADLALGLAGTPDQARFTDTAAAQVLSDFESRTNLPKTSTHLPTYIVRGDADKLVDTTWSTDAITKMCHLGIRVHDLVIPGGHAAPDNASEQWLSFIGDLFGGSPIASTCPH